MNGLVTLGDEVWYGNVHGELLVCGLDDGRVRDRIRSVEHGQLRCVSGDIALVRTVDGFDAVHRRHGVVWSRECGLFAAAVTMDDAFLVAEESGATVVCLEAASGLPRWSIRVVPESAPRELRDMARLPSGFPSLAPVQGGIVMVNAAADVMFVDANDGSLMSHQRAPFPGVFNVGHEGVQFLTTKEFSVFDWRTMSEVEHASFAGEADLLYGKTNPAVFGFVATAKAIVWSAANGLLLGVQRHPSPGRARQTWRDEVGGLSPIAVNPKAWGDFVYWATQPRHGANDPATLFAFRSPGSD